MISCAWNYVCVFVGTSCNVGINIRGISPTTGDLYVSYVLYLIRSVQFVVSKMFYTLYILLFSLHTKHTDIIIFIHIVNIW